MINSVIERLEALTDDDGKRIINDVKPALDIVETMSASLKVNVVVFVVLLEEQPGNNHRDMAYAPAIQTINETVGVLIGIRTTGRSEQDKNQLERVRKAIRGSLFGWTPTPIHSNFLLGKSNIQKIQSRQLFWMDRFTNQHDEEASQ